MKLKTVDNLGIPQNVWEGAKRFEASGYDASDEFEKIIQGKTHDCWYYLECRTIIQEALNLGELGNKFSHAVIAHSKELPASLKVTMIGARYTCVVNGSLTINTERRLKELAGGITHEQLVGV